MNQSQPLIVSKMRRLKIENEHKMIFLYVIYLFFQDGYTLLHLAVINTNPGIVDLLQQKKFDMNITDNVRQVMFIIRMFY